MHAYEFDTEHGIGLCGDWLNGGKVQGAWLSGLKLANKLIAHNQDS
jgi:predicted NAD/FAD-dependent oxidoreductase